MWQNKFFMKKKNTAEKQLANIEEGLSKTEQFIEDNSKVMGYPAKNIKNFIRDNK